MAPVNPGDEAAADGQRLLDEVVQRLVEALPALSDATCDRIYQTLRTYDGVGREALGAAVERNMRTCLTALRTGIVPEPPELSGAAQTAAERFESGLRVEEIVQGFRISIALIHELFVDVSIQVGLPINQVVRGSRLMWGVGDAFTTRIITEYHQLEVGASLKDARYRVSLVRGLIDGTATPEAQALLDPRHPYAVLRCDVSQAEHPESVRQQLETLGSEPRHPALVALDGDECVGIVAQRPSHLQPVAGLGSFGPPTDLSQSDASARQCLTLARHLGRDGIQTTTDLGWRLAAMARPDVWRAQRERYVNPVLALGAFGADVLLVARTWLEEANSVGRTAQRLSLHVNTVRYRLARYQEVIGVDLDDPEHRNGVWWALEMGDPDDPRL